MKAEWPEKPSLNSLTKIIKNLPSAERKNAIARVLSFVARYSYSKASYGTLAESLALLLVGQLSDSRQVIRLAARKPAIGLSLSHSTNYSWISYRKRNPRFLIYTVLTCYV